MRRRLVLCLAAALGTPSLPAAGAELAGMPAFLLGPVGDCPIFSETSRVEAEVRLSSARGTLRRDDDSDGAGDETMKANTLDAGTTTPFGPDVLFNVNATWRTRTVSLSSAQQAAVSAGPTIWFDRLALGGAVGAVLIDDETHRAATEPAPLLTAYAGWRGEGMTTALQVRTSDSVRTVVEEGSAKQTFYRRAADTVALLSRIVVQPEFDLGLDLKHWGQDRDLAGDVVSANHWGIGLGGRYRTAVGIDLASSLQYVEPSSKDRYPPSAYAANLGETRLGVGLASRGRGIGYQLDIGYAASPTTQTSVQQKTWDVAFGTIARF